MNGTDVRCALRAAKYAALLFVCCALTCAGALCISANVAVAVPQRSEGVGVAIPSQGSPSKRPAATNNVVELPLVTISGSEREVTFDLSEIQRLLKAGETLEIEVLTKEGKEYAGELAEFYRRADTFCLMAALSSDLVVAQRCPRANSTQALERWSNAINYLGEIARGGTPDKRATASYAAFVRANPGTVDLILNGRRVVTAKVKDLLGIIKGTTPMANPGEIEFEGCSFPAKATGEKLSKVCHSSLPLAPVEPSLSDKRDKLVLARQTEQKASVVVQITPRKQNTGKRVRKAAKEPLVVVLPVELAQASNPTTASTDATSSTADSTTSTEITSTTEGTTTSEHSSESSSSSSIGNTGNSTETTSTTEETTTSLETTTVTEDTTTTTSVSSEPAFTSRCGETNTLKAWTKLERTDRTYVGWACNPLSEHNGCFVNSKGECPDVIERKSECKTFCREYPNRLAEYEKNKAAAQKACADRIKEKAQNLPSAVGMCPGAEACPGGTKGCINPSGNGSFELSIPDGTMRWDPPSRDEWNECFTYFCDPMPREEITYTWQCSGCENESSESSSPDTTSTTEGTTTSEYSSESSSSSSTGDTENSTETTSTTEETTTSVESTTVTEDTTSTTERASTSEGKPDCYVCIYDKNDERLRRECDFLANKAKENGQMTVVVDQFEALDRRKELCKCKNIDVRAAVHGSPGDEAEPFTEIREILKVAPQCSNITFENMRCSGFDSADKALRHAKDLAHTMAKNGFGGTVTVNGFQTINISTLHSLVAELKAELLNDAGPIQQILVRTAVAKAKQESLQICSNLNTPMGFQVCAQDVKLLLSPCKTTGQVSIVDKSASATTTIVCQLDGKRANQSCNFIKLNDIKDTKLRQSLESKGYGEDGCDDTGPCLCEWKKPEGCAK